LTNVAILQLNVIQNDIACVCVFINFTAELECVAYAWLSSGVGFLVTRTTELQVRQWCWVGKLHVFRFAFNLNLTDLSLSLFPF